MKYSKGSYYISVYDLQDNNIMGFDSIDDCSRYFNVSKNTIYNCLCRGARIGCKYLLIKDIFDNSVDDNIRRFK